MEVMASEWLEMERMVYGSHEGSSNRDTTEGSQGPQASPKVGYRSDASRWQGADLCQVITLSGDNNDGRRLAFSPLFIESRAQ